MPSRAVTSGLRATRLSLRQLLEIEALRVGFSEVGVTDLAPFEVAAERARRALMEGRMGGMPWYTEERINHATDLGQRYPWGRSLVALSYPYQPAAGPASTPVDPPRSEGRPRGRIAGYALGDDYHARLDRALRQLVDRLAVRSPGLRWHRFVDHGRAWDRAIAERAGLGFCGKHTQLITERGGSYVLLASLVLSLELAPDQSSKRSCGKCRACLPSCPTGALLAPGVIDAPRCISYLTIEHEGPIPRDLRPLMGTWVFGCDLCQEACPINQRLSAPPVRPGRASTSEGPVPFPDLVELLCLSETSFQARFRHTTMRRSGRERLARNAAVALGNAGEHSAVPALARAMGQDPSALVRGASAWALGQLGGEAATSELTGAVAREGDPEVVAEIQRALLDARRTLESTPRGLRQLGHSA
ncbi:MAG TPA: tRNA epoxyqueuosine(34) reductase QueG [Candidatus Dormibacteraeota bacterium]|nr:tRNA epoxyqueuosine(34) reductase QueG [Candidatus Dormibacteraeota bacterium]